MSLATLGVTLLENMLAGNGAIRAGELEHAKIFNAASSAN